MIEMQEVCLRAGDFSIDSISFKVESGQYAVLMGRTGLGKTTILESICGLRHVHSGRILVHGTDVTDWSPADREVGYMPQALALFPTLNVSEHLAFALRLRGQNANLIQQRTSELASVLGIEHLLHRKINDLSGGESQRVALGRALSFRPAVLLLDEPLSALDEGTRQEMQTLLMKVSETTGVTTLHVTHNPQEAEILADRRFQICEDRFIEIDSTHRDSIDS